MNRSAAWVCSLGHGPWQASDISVSLSDTTSSQHHNFPVHSLSSWATTTASTAFTTGVQRAEMRMLCRLTMPWTVRYFSLSKYRMPWHRQTIVEIQGASDLLKLLTSFTIQNLLASLAHNQLTDCTRETQRQCKNWFGFRIGSAK